LDTEKAYQGYVQDRKILQAPYQTFAAWSKNRLDYVTISQKRARANLDLMHSQAVKNGPGSNIFYIALTDIQSAMNPTIEFPGLNMVVDIGMSRRRRMKRRKRDLSNLSNHYQILSQHHHSIHHDAFYHHHPKSQQDTSQSEQSEHHRKPLLRRDSGLSTIRTAVQWSVPALDQQLNVWKQNANGQPEFYWSTTQTKSTSTSDNSHSNSGVKGPELPGILQSVYQNDHTVDTTDKSLTTMDEMMNVAITFQGIALLQVQPGNWWQPNWAYPSMLDPNQTDQMKKVPEFNQLFDSYFAPGRWLNRIHQYLLVAYKPKIEATFTKSDFSRIEHAYHAEKNVCILFICNKIHDRKNDTTTSTKFIGQKVVIEHTTESPLILAKGFSRYK